jgi:hypothetical protein
MSPSGMPYDPSEETPMDVNSFYMEFHNVRKETKKEEQHSQT